MKPAVFHPQALRAIRALPPEVRSECGALIQELQRGVGLSMPESRPMPMIGAGVAELRIRAAAGSFRAFYLVDAANVRVFHVYQKKAQKTPFHEIATARKCLRETV